MIDRSAPVPVLGQQSAVNTVHQALKAQRHGGLLLTRLCPDDALPQLVEILADKHIKQRQ